MARRIASSSARLPEDRFSWTLTTSPPPLPKSCSISTTASGLPERSGGADRLRRILAATVARYASSSPGLAPAPLFRRSLAFFAEALRSISLSSEFLKSICLSSRALRSGFSGLDGPLGFSCFGGSLGFSFFVASSGLGCDTGFSITGSVLGGSDCGDAGGLGVGGSGAGLGAGLDGPTRPTSSEPRGLLCQLMPKNRNASSPVWTTMVRTSDRKLRGFSLAGRESIRKSFIVPCCSTAFAG